MARNKFDVDERLETPFDFKHFKRAMVYVKRYKWKMILALSLSAISAIVALIGPLLTKEAVDVAIPDGNIPYIVFLSIGFLLSIIVSVVLGNIRQRIMTKAGQLMIYDIRKDLFAHLQELPFQYYDDRPQGKILVRVVNYVNNVSDMLTNGIINFILEIFNLIFITIFMFSVDARLALVIFAGVPVFIVVMIILKTSREGRGREFQTRTPTRRHILLRALTVCV